MDRGTRRDTVGYAAGIPHRLHRLLPALSDADVEPVVEIGDVQADLHYLLVERRGADERPTVTSVETDTGRYWRARSIINLEF